MQKYFEVLMKNPLFQGIEAMNLESMLNCLDAQNARFEAEETIFRNGDPAKRIGLILEGRAQVIRYDVMGNRSILTHLDAGDLFGETFACAGVDILPVSVAAVTSCAVLLLDFRRIITTCPNSCAFHSQLIENMLRILAQKNLLLNRKVEAVSARTIRQKLMTYLAGQAQRAGARQFSVPFGRQELADYLSVDRSAMSRELGLMQKEGLIKYDKKNFELLKISDEGS